VVVPVVSLLVVVLAPRSFDPGSRTPENPFDLTGLRGALLVVYQLTFAVTNLAVVVGAGSLVVLAAVAVGAQPGAAGWWLRRGRPWPGPALGRDSSLAVAGATLAVAALFQPARRRIQQAADRRFNRRRHDATTTIEAFSGRLHQQIDLDTLTAELLALVDQTMQPTRLAVAPVLGHHPHRPTIS
jgi:hypothetical protein